MRALLVLAVVAVGLGAALWSRFAALLLYLWFSLFRPQEWAWGDLNAFRLSLVVGLALVGPSLLSGVLPNLSHPLSRGSLAFLATAFLAQTTAFRPDVAWPWVDQLFRVIVVSLLLVTLTVDRRKYLAVVGVVAGSLGIHAVKLGMVFLLHGGARFKDGIGGTFGDNNDLGLALVRVLPLLFALAQLLRWRSARLALYSALPLTVLAIIGTYSRGAFLALFASVLALISLQKRKLWSILTCSAVIATAMLFVQLPADYMERMGTIRTYEDAREDSALGRLHFWNVAIEVVKRNPLGVGLRNFEQVFDQYDTSNGEFGRRRSVHSSHFQVLAETGYGGFCVWAFLLSYSLWITFRVRRLGKDPHLSEECRNFYFMIANALIASQIAFLIGGSFLAQALNDLNWITFGLVAALHRTSLRESEGDANGAACT